MDVHSQLYILALLIRDARSVPGDPEDISSLHEYVLRFGQRAGWSVPRMQLEAQTALRGELTEAARAEVAAVLLQVEGAAE